MNSLLNICKSLIPDCDKEIEINGTRSINYELWIKGKKNSYTRVIDLIERRYDKKLIERFLKCWIIDSLKYQNTINSDAIKSYYKGKTEGYEFIIKHLNN